MNKNLILILASLTITSVSADFFDFHDNLFKYENVCADEQVKDEVSFKKMFSQLKKDELKLKSSIIEITDYSMYSTTLLNVETGNECSIIIHDHCYSVSCD